MIRTRSARIVFVAALFAAFGSAMAQQIRFAAFGDYGQSSNTQSVATRVLAMTPDFICTTGDNTYSTTVSVSNWDNAVGQYYRSYIQLPAASAHFAQSSPVNKFFPVLGNHDFDVGNSATSYTNYFIGLPGNRRYYTFTQGPVQFFMLSSDPREPSGVTVGSTQYNWFVNAIGQSTAPWKVVMFHHPFQTSTTSSHAPSAYMNWGFENLGVDMVLQGHNHIMERINYGGITWIVTGAGGRSHYTITSIAAGSQFRNTTLYGFSMVTADATSLRHEFISAAGAVLDSVTLTAPPPPCPGDTNGDLAILSVLLAQFGQNVTPGAGADVNGDGVVNGEDLSVLLARFGSAC
jgi:tartrate-resistant acid phosphatase type 5